MSEQTQRKTIARIETDPTDPEYGSRSDGTVLIHFTDGTALRVTGSSYEDVSLWTDDLIREEVRAYQRAAVGRREAERLRRLQREELAALPAEEKEAREARRRAAMTPFERAIDDSMLAVARSMGADYNRQLFGRSA